MVSVVTTIQPEKDTSNYVTDKKYYMDKRLKYYLDMIINERLSKESEDDALIICEGDEGTGKSSMAGHIGYYMAQKTNRSFSGKTFWLNTDDMMKFAARTYRQVICWDEPAVSGMSDEWWNEEQRKLKKMLVMIRQHQHLYIFNFARFHKFGEFFIVDRSIAMIKTFKRNRIEHGHFMYFNTMGKEHLWNDWHQKHLKTYQSHASFVGRFFTPLSDFMTTEEYAEYKKRKDQATIDMVDGKSKKDVNKEKLLKLRYKIAIMKREWLQNIKTIEELAAWIGADTRDFVLWRKYPVKYPKLFDLPNKNDEIPKEMDENSLITDSNIDNTLDPTHMMDDDID